MIRAGCSLKKKNRALSSCLKRKKKTRKTKNRLRKKSKIYFGSGNKKQSLLNKRNLLFKDQIPLLTVIRDLTPEQRVIILNSLNKRGQKCIIECVKKVVRGKELDLSSRKKLASALYPQKEILRQIISTKKTKDIEQLVPKLGGSIGLILGTVIPLLLDLAHSAKWL